MASTFTNNQQCELCFLFLCNLVSCGFCSLASFSCHGSKWEKVYARWCSWPHSTGSRSSKPISDHFYFGNFYACSFLYNLALKLGWCLFDIFLFIPLITTFNYELSWFLYAFMLLKFSIFSLELCEFMTLNIFYSTICHYLWME